jgi:multidrug resistance efflux pump
MTLIRRLEKTIREIRVIRGKEFADCETQTIRSTMSQSSLLDLAQCSQFRQTLQARPPRIVHGAAALVFALLTAAVAWAALTRADLVVRAGGRMRPVTAPQKVMATFRGEVLTGGAGALVREVTFREGDSVKQGDVLLRLDTERLDNEIVRVQRQILAEEEEIRKGNEMARLLGQQYASARAKLEAELAKVEEGIRLAVERRQSELRSVEAELKHAQADEARKRKLVSRQVAARADLETAVFKLSEAREKLAQARLPVETGQRNVLLRTLAGLQEDHRIKLAELSVKQQANQSELDVSRLDLANLQLEQRQAEIRAPASGVVTSGDIKPGDTLEPSKPVLEIAEQSGFRFELAVPTGEMEHVQVGMPVRIRLDAFDYQRYGTVQGVVQYISADSVVNQEDGSVAYLVKVDVQGHEIGRGDLREAIKLGLTGQAEILTGSETLLSLLVQKIRRTISLG